MVASQKKVFNLNLNTMETRKDIPWYEGLYQVSNLGNIKSLNYNHTWKERLVNSWIAKWYCYIHLYKNTIDKIYKIHRLVAQAFIPNSGNKPQVNHKNWIRNDNRIENLEWCTNGENILHSYNILWQNRNMLWLLWKDNPKSKKVNQYTKRWEFVKTRDSISDISRQLKYNQWNISSCCLWKKNHSTVWWYKRSFTI